MSLLQDQLEDRLGPSRGVYAVSLFRSAQFTAPPTNTVSLLLYRVDTNPALRDVPENHLLVLRLSYLLTVWGESCASEEQEILQHCMEILNESPILRESPLTPCLCISLEPLTNDEMMRLWQGFDLPYQLSVSYLVTPLAQPE